MRIEFLLNFIDWSPKRGGQKTLFNFPRFFCISKKKLIITKSTAAKPFAFAHFARYMKYEIGEDANVVLVVFLFNSDKLPIIFAKLKKKTTPYGWADRWTDGQTEGWTD